MKRKTSLLRSELMLLKPFISNCSLAVARRGQDKTGDLMMNIYKNDIECQEIKIGEMNCAMMIPNDELSSGIILYIHGGGYTCGTLSYAKGFAAALAAKCGIKVLCIEYRLAPEHIFPAAIDDTLEAYGYLLSNGYDPSRIILCGESSGGGLCYALAHKLRDKGRSMPAGIIAISPWTDLTASGDSYKTNAQIDPSMTEERLKYFADCYVYGAERVGKRLYPKKNPDIEEDLNIKRNPMISPLFASQEKMPPSLIFVGSDEIMLDDSIKLHGKLLEAGSESTLHIADNMWHGYILYGMKECEGDFDKMSKFIKKCVPAQKKLRWMALDNAAKIFPAARNRHWSNVFRLSATFKEPIDRDIMQSALDVTIRRFPSIAVRLKAGVFWYYLEQIPKTPMILDEKPYPLSGMPIKDIKKCAFRVFIYGNRIAVELFHSLTDGNGGLTFIKTLSAEYIYQRYGVKVPTGDGIFDRLEEPSEDELEDSFIKYAGDVPASRADTDAYRITAKREVDGFKTNTTFILDSSDVVAAAKARGLTVTAYLAAAFVVAAANVQRQHVAKKRKYKHIKVLIPVNLRKMFPSTTMRNFVLYANTGIDPRLGDYTFDEICAIISHQMKLQITEKNMAAMIKTNVNSEKNPVIRVVPLFLKNFVMKLVFNAVGEKKSCFSFSNLGVVRPPEEFSRFVERMDFVIGVQAAAPYNLSALTYGDKIYLNVIRNISEPILEREIHNVLRELSVRHVVESNSRERRD